MTEPTPAQPSEGAVICRLRDVPEGWEWRIDDTEAWCARVYPDWRGRLVEARRVPEPTVTIELPLSVVEDRATGGGGHFDVITDACKTALAEREGEQ